MHYTTTGCVLHQLEDTKRGGPSNCGIHTFTSLDRACKHKEFDVLDSKEGCVYRRTMGVPSSRRGL